MSEDKRYACPYCGALELEEKDNTPENVTIYQCTSCGQSYTKDNIPGMYIYPRGIKNEK